MRHVRIFSWFLALGALALAMPSQGRADDKSFPAQARLFVGVAKIDPKDVNPLMSSQGLQSFSALAQYGVEITYPLLRYLDVGMRYSRRGITQHENGAGTLPLYSGTISQDAIFLLARVPVVRTSLFKFDVFGAAGGSNTGFDLRSAAQNGSLTKREAKDWVASPIAAYGASAGIGYQRFYLFAEGGMEHNTVSRMAHSGTLNGSVSSLGLTGPYALIGILFDGISATQR